MSTAVLRKRFILKSNFLLLFTISLNLFSQTGTYSWSGYTAGAASYTTGVMVATTTLTSATMQYASPKYYSGSMVGSGQCGIAGGLGLRQCLEILQIQILRSIWIFLNNLNQNGICASVQFNIEDINADESYQTFADWVVISAVDANGTAVPAANIAITPGSNVTVVTSGATKILKGYSGSYGSRSTTACNITSVTVTPPAGIPLTSILINYHPDYTACSSCYYNFTGPYRPAYQYISIGQLNATTTGGTGCTIILPVELFSLTGNCFGIKKTLQWTTASEINNNYFTIEHSKDGLNFEALATIKASGNSDTKINYEYSFDEESVDYNYYRLTQTDMNGKVGFLKSIYLNCANKVGSLKLFPNPSNDKINLKFECTDASEFLIIVTDIAGRVVKSITHTAALGDNEVNVSVDNLQAGVYYVTLVDTQGNLRLNTIKFVKGNQN